MPRLSTALVVATLCSLAPLTAQAQQALPDGPEKALVEGACSTCHKTTEIPRSSGYTREGWKEIAGTMIDLSKTPEEQNKIFDELNAMWVENVPWVSMYFQPRVFAQSSQLKGEKRHVVAGDALFLHRRQVRK